MLLEVVSSDFSLVVVSVSSSVTSSVVSSVVVSVVSSVVVVVIFVTFLGSGFLTVAAFTAIEARVDIANTAKQILTFFNIIFAPYEINHIPKK